MKKKKKTKDKSENFIIIENKNISSWLPTKDFKIKCFLGEKKEFTKKKKK